MIAAPRWTSRQSCWASLPDSWRRIHAYRIHSQTTSPGGCHTNTCWINSLTQFPLTHWVSKMETLSLFQGEGKIIIGLEYNVFSSLFFQFFFFVVVASCTENQISNGKTGNWRNACDCLFKHLCCIHNAPSLRLSYYCNWILIRPENCLDFCFQLAPIWKQDA